MRTYVRVRAAATILHADLDSFYASVEQRDDPALRGRPVIVGGGVVLAASYEAKAYGVRTAMGGRQARQLCPHAIVVPPRMSAYSQASDAVFEVFRDTTPLVEPLSVDEAFLDVSGLRRVSGTPVRDRGPAARAGPRPRRPADHRRHRPHQVPGQGRQPGGQARRPAAGAARPRVGVPASAAGAAAVGRRRQDRREAARARHRDGGRCRRAQRVDPRVAGRRRDGPSAICVVPQHRPAPGRHRRAPPLGRGAARARSGRQHDVGRRGRRRRGQPRSTASPDGCARPAAPAARWCCGCGSTTSAGPPARTPCPARPRPPTSSSTPPAGWSRRRRR